MCTVYLLITVIYVKVVLNFVCNVLQYIYAVSRGACEVEFVPKRQAIAVYFYAYISVFCFGSLYLVKFE